MMLQITDVLMLSCVLGMITLALATDLTVVLSLATRALALARTERPELKSKRCACALAGFRRA